MKNADKLLKDGVSIEEVADEFESFCEVLKENYIVLTYKQEMEQFLSCEIESTLTEDERVILRNMTKPNIKAIGRRNSALYLLDNTGEKEFFMNYMYRDLFQFIKERRRIQHTRIVRR